MWGNNKQSRYRCFVFFILCSTLGNVFLVLLIEKPGFLCAWQPGGLCAIAATAGNHLHSLTIYGFSVHCTPGREQAVGSIWMITSLKAQGNTLTTRQIEAFTSTLRAPEAANTSDMPPVSPIDAGTYDHYLSITEMFLSWTLDSMNRGGRSVLTLEQLSAERAHLTALFRSLRMGARPSQRMEPLEDQEIELIRKAIGPKREGQGSWAFPEGRFAPHTRLRNWLMFEMALELGVRRGELLKLRLDSLPRGSDDGIRVLRHPDDPLDTRSREPAVKTAERIIPASRPLLVALRAYLTLPAPLGRVRSKSPYLFVTETGDPLSLDRADDIIQAIGRSSGIAPLSWHRLRHTWSEQWATRLLACPNGKDILQYLGGWTNPHSPDRYIQHTIAQQAADLMRAYQRTLYSGEAALWM